MSDQLQAMLSVLSEQDRETFEQLAEKVKQVAGDLSQLSPADLALIETMEAKYQEQIQQAHQESGREVVRPDILFTEFADFVRRRLQDEFGHLGDGHADLVKQAFEQKWLPMDFKDDSIALEIYSDFEEDIQKICHFSEIGEAAKDKEPKVLLGLAWFMVIYQLNLEVQNS